MFCTPKHEKLSGIFIVLSALVFLLPALVSAQTERRTFDLSVDPQYRDYFILDHFGLRLINDGLILESFIDTETYQLGPNDVLSIEMSGGLEHAMRGLVINPEGVVFIPGLGRVSLKGKTLSEARDHIAEQLMKNFAGGEVQLTLDVPRPQNIHIHGEVESPGRYVVPFQTRLDQAIYRALISPTANPDRTGMFQYERGFLEDSRFSLRNITIQRADGTELTADLIHYFRTGDKFSNPYIQDGDKIFIRRLLSEAPRISISGAVGVPLNVEYKEGDTIQDLLDMAGGFAYDSENEKVTIHRRSSQGIESISVEGSDTDFSTYYLNPNDRLIAPIDREKHLTQSIHIHGEVAQPGNYPITEGQTTVADLLELSGGLRSSALKNGAYLIRSSVSSDRVLRTDVASAELLQRTSDQLVQGLEYLQLEAALNRNQIFLDLNDTATLENITVFDGDRIFIPRDEQTVMIMGQVNTPGFYNVSENGSVNQYIQDAGGFALAAEESRVFVIKAGSRSWYKPGETTIESGDIIFVDRVPYDELHSQRMFRNNNIQLILTGITTLATVITTYAVYRR